MSYARIREQQVATRKRAVTLRPSGRLTITGDFTNYDSAEAPSRFLRGCKCKGDLSQLSEPQRHFLKVTWMH